MTMSKESSVGWILVGFAFGMEIVLKALGLDGNAETILKGVMALGFGYIGLRGVSGILKKE
jgi:hypothetical protein